MSKDLAISLIPLALRRMTGVKTVSSGAVNRPIPQSEFQDGCRRHQQEAAQSLYNMPSVVAGLWKTEGFATTMGKYRLAENTLNDPKIPRESYGITHVG
ncbi:MAG TPA: hypothetical protein VGP94_15345, partial [Tepidisphaeraceae bacterium]|nr:hypothetical protein [Tepidisphaeraceae bacterium]